MLKVLFLPCEPCYAATFPLLKFATSSHRCFSTSRPLHDGRTYAEALELLHSLQSNRTITSTIGSTSHDMNKTAIPEMLEWTRIAGYKPADFKKHGLKFIHVAGTKGKGSVCVMVESILLEHVKLRSTKARPPRSSKIGLYTSPHLVHVRERIRINGKSISEELFTRYFFQLWDKFSDTTESKMAEAKPGYFRYLTILAFHTFIQEGVGTAILECGIGGEYDSTNIIPPESVAVSGIASLGIDHVGMLGNTIESIAWHKSGIMKSGVQTYTVEQPPAAQLVLEQRAVEKGGKLTVVPVNPILKDVSLGLKGPCQIQNASLALALSAHYLSSQNPTLIPQTAIHALETVSWPGRCQILRQENLKWFLDGAHTEESIKSTVSWFGEHLSKVTPDQYPDSIILIFNQEGERDASKLLRTLIWEMKKFGGIWGGVFTSAVFCTNSVWKEEVSEDEKSLVATRDKSSIAADDDSQSGTKNANTLTENRIPNYVSQSPYAEKHPSRGGLRNQALMKRVFLREYGYTKVNVLGCVEEAVEMVGSVVQDIKSKSGEKDNNSELVDRQNTGKGGDVWVLVTGSLHLVGGVLEVLEKGVSIPWEGQSEVHRIIEGRKR